MDLTETEDIKKRWKEYTEELYKTELRVVLVTQLCLTLCSHMDCSLPGSSFHGILQVRILEWIAIPFSKQTNKQKNLSDPDNHECGVTHLEPDILECEAK